MQQTKTLYETDYQAWVEDTVTRVRAGDLAGLDWENLLEEIESLGISQRNALSSQWIRVVKHLLKLEIQPEASDSHNSWVSSAIEGLKQIKRLLQNSPSLRGYMQSNQADWYEDARDEASVETQLAKTRFPETCPYDIEALIDGIYPETLRYYFVFE